MQVNKQKMARRHWRITKIARLKTKDKCSEVSWDFLRFSPSEHLLILITRHTGQIESCRLNFVAVSPCQGNKNWKSRLPEQPSCGSNYRKGNPTFCIQLALQALAKS